ncbi:hypothetical protein P22_0200 [Propionispora sp. 2/2-37]|nr:hypothetical protein P22_0200 [Propionispora sp. 2/2-37]
MLSRRQRHRSVTKLQNKYLLIGLTVVLMSMAVISTALSEKAAVPALAGQVRLSGQELSMVLPTWQELLFSGVPGLQTVAEKRPLPRFDMEQFGINLFQVFTSIDLGDMRSLITSEIPVLASVKNGNLPVSSKPVAILPNLKTAGIADTGKPLIGIYHTHTAESYIPTSGVAHKPGGQIGDIVGVGQALVQQMAKYQITAIQSNTIHDYPSFMKAYGPSEITAKKMLEENPSIQMIFDIHRDAQKRENTTVVINGKEAAKIMIIVATGQPDLVQPHWQENHAFAKLIDSKLNQHYPGLSRGIQLVEWRYNQHLHPRALLLEVGCQENSLEEATRSMEMLGDVLAEIIAENKLQQGNTQ